MSRVRTWLASFGLREAGQATILVAVLMPALMAILGVTIEGGRAFVEYRKLQAAADMSALVGAQSLPCSTTDTSCITAAETLACTYAGNNGFSGCSAGGSSSPSANVPPLSCSPYDFIDYGNGSGNSNCKSARAPSFYSYIETALTDNLGTIPIFNIPVTLSAHAIAKHGPQIPSDFALISLDPTVPLDLTGNTTVQVTGSIFSNGGILGGGSATGTTCAGGWYSASSVSGVNTNSTGTPTFSPPGCTGNNDPVPATQGNLAQVSDPYAGSSPPPTQPLNSTFTNCPDCSKAGYWYDLTAHTWHQGGTPSGNVELFPGVYSTIYKNSGDMYFNPGVYTFTSGIDINHGRMCVYGSPSCNNDSCASTAFAPGSIAGDQWYYSCSPYGFWDSQLSRSGAPGGGPSLTAPTFFDATTGAASTVPLNGITFYLPPGSGGLLTVHGNTGTTGGVYPAASNPCPGTGSFTTGTNPAVSFTAGSASGVFQFSGTSYPTNNYGLPNDVNASREGVVYPSEDFTLLGECAASTHLEDWAGEFTKPQHLHFLLYSTDTTASLLNGASGQQLTGIIYIPDAPVTINGAGKAAGGPPWINGQLVLKSAYFSGNSTNDITYRQCSAGSTSCGSGSGTQLIQ